MLLIMIILALVLLFYYYLIKPQLYWKFKHVKQGPPIPLFGDNLKTMFRKESMIEMAKKVYNRFPNERYSGMYQATIPTLILRDPELIKQITVKDFDHFMNHISLGSEDIEPLFNKNLLFVKDEKWRDMRAILSPAFTGSKMRLMFELMNNSARQYVDYFLKQEQNVIEHELKGSFTRFANDVIANCAFGVTVDSLKEPENAFFENSRVLTEFSGFRAAVVGMMALIAPKLIGFLGLSLFPRATMEFFRNLLKTSIKTREEQNIVRPDMINLLMEAQKGRLTQDIEESSPKDASEGFATVEEFSDGSNLNKKLLTEEEMVAQVLIFFFAGFETVSNMASFLCYELALNPDVQDKLRNEIDRTNRKNSDNLTYDVLNKMKYLDMCASESLRKNPPVPFIDRVCTKPYTIQPKAEGEHPLHLAPDDVLWLPIAGLHYDPKYYEKPEIFNPERFSDVNKAKINSYAYIPFGSGPRNCIGSRFALMEVKTLIFHILSKFELVVIERTTIPLKYDRSIMNPAILGGCWIGFKSRSK